MLSCVGAGMDSELEPCACFSCKRADDLLGTDVGRFGFEETAPKVAIVAPDTTISGPVPEPLF